MHSEPRNGFANDPVCCQFSLQSRVLSLLGGFVHRAPVVLGLAEDYGTLSAQRTTRGYRVEQGHKTESNIL